MIPAKASVPCILLNGQTFGGDFRFEKYQADYRYYYRMGKDNVWALNLGAGYANGDMPLSQRFTVGGSEFLRGYRDDQFKGNSMLKGSLEFRYPIIKQVQGVTFTDGWLCLEQGL